MIFSAVAFTAVAIAATVSPSPSPVPSCAGGNHEAVVLKAVQPEPDAGAVAMARSRFDENGGVLIAKIEVTIGPDGKVVSTKVYQSTGSPSLDKAALAAVSASTYSPKIVNCTPVTGIYLAGFRFSNLR